MKLIGSKTSPFVRRIRLLLKDRPYEFEPVDVFSSNDRPKILEANPVGRVPIFRDEGRTLWDSRIITRYLLEKMGRPLPSIEQELALDLVDNATDTGVILFQIRRFKLDEKWENTYSQVQVERLNRLLQQVEPKAPGLTLEDLHGTWTYCLLDWLLFREVSDLAPFPKLREFHAAQAKDAWIESTNPRL